jgi:hypothetical protein
VKFHPGSYIRHALLRALLPCAQAPALVLLPGCATPIPASAPASPLPYLISRDGALRYRLPQGWFDAPADTLADDRCVWLVRDDYAGSLTVREVHMRAVEKTDLEGEGLLQVAKLTAALETARKPGILRREPDRSRINGRNTVTYDVDYSGSGDRTRTVLLASEGRVFAVTALVNGAAPQGTEKDVFGVLQSFVAGLRL